MPRQDRRDVEESTSFLLCTCGTFGTIGIRCELFSSHFKSRLMHCVPVAPDSTLPFLVSYRKPPHSYAKRHCATSAPSICNHAMAQEFQTRVTTHHWSSWNSVFPFRCKIPKLFPRSFEWDCQISHISTFELPFYIAEVSLSLSFSVLWTTYTLGIVINVVNGFISGSVESSRIAALTESLCVVGLCTVRFCKDSVTVHAAAVTNASSALEASVSMHPWRCFLQ